MEIYYVFSTPSLSFINKNTPSFLQTNTKTFLFPLEFSKGNQGVLSILHRYVSTPNILS